MTMMDGSNFRPASRLSAVVRSGSGIVCVSLLTGGCGSTAAPTASSNNPSRGAETEDAASSGSGEDSSSPANSSGGGPSTTPPGGNADSDSGSAGQPAGYGDAGAMKASDAGPVNGGSPQKSAGCGMAKPATVETSIMVGSSTGNITVDVPTDYDNNKAYPLILVWHGFGVTGTAFHGYLDIHTAVGNDAVVVTPECLGGGSSWPSDMSYPDALVAHFEAKYCIDKSRLFTAGHSMGGLYTGQIGCERGDVFRGDAVLAAPHPTGVCKKGTMAVYMAVGSSDPTGTTTTTEFPWWAMENGCSSTSTPVDPMSFYTMALDESGTCVDYSGCGALTPFRACTFSGGHEIPPWEALAIWNFFKKL
jgi:polyhydroxybutyrate depolymerase